jgi:protein SCO1
MNRPATVVLLLSLGGALGFALPLIAPDVGVQQSIEWLGNPRPIERFHLEGTAGAFDNDSLEGRWTFVVFGFLRCPDICPTSLLQMAALADSLSEQSLDEQMGFVFVSVDPGRDSVSDLEQYVPHFHSSILGVTGQEEQLAQFAGDLGIQFEVSPGEEMYSVAHSVTFSIVDPEGVFRGRFRPGFDLSHLVENFLSKLN